MVASPAEEVVVMFGKMGDVCRIMAERALRVFGKFFKECLLAWSFGLRIGVVLGLSHYAVYREVDGHGPPECVQAFAVL